MDISSLAVDRGQHGLDPLVEKQADEFGRRAWTMDIEPILVQWLGRELADDEVAVLQQLVFEHKYNVLLNSAEKKAEKAKVGKRW